MPAFHPPGLSVKPMVQKLPRRSGRWGSLGPAILVSVLLALPWPYPGTRAQSSAPAEPSPSPQSLKEDTLPLESEQDNPEDPGETIPLEPEAPAQIAPEIPESEPEPAGPRPDTPDSAVPVYLRPPHSCPPELERLVARLLQDLPTYAQLVAGRSLGVSDQRFSPFGMVIIASQPDYEPLALAENPYGDPASVDTQQVFFTTLERQYWRGQPVSLQNHHWLFLAPAETGWYLSQMYSMVGHSPADRGAPSPPQESSDGIIGQAVTLWLRDCRAGAVFPPE